MGSTMPSIDSLDLDSTSQSSENGPPTSGNVRVITSEKQGPSARMEPVPRWLQQEKHEWRRRIHNFTPSWFSITMGTGIVSILLQTNPWATSWVRILATIIFCLNVLLFSAITTVTILRYVLYPRLWIVMLRHPSQSLFVGTVPMGFATIVNMFVFVCVPHWGAWATTFAWVLWWIDVVVSMLTCLVLPFLMMYSHKSSPALSSMTAAWLLPVVAPIVAAASGAIVAPILPNPQHQLWTIMISYVMLGAGLPLAICLLTIYLRRLLEHKLPPREMIVSTFLPLGPFGQGGSAFQKLGKVAMDVFPKTNTLHPMAGDFFYVSGFLAALILWGFGLVWLFLALASTSRYRKIPFNVSWWAATFPWGVFATSTLQLGVEMSSTFFKVLGTIFSGCVILLWLVVMIGTVRKAITGEMFYSPCLMEAKQEYERARNTNTTISDHEALRP